MNYDSFGYALAMEVMQSDLYNNLPERARAECDEMIARGQGRAELPSQGNSGPSCICHDDRRDRQCPKHGDEAIGEGHMEGSGK